MANSTVYNLMIWHVIINNYYYAQIAPGHKLVRTQILKYKSRIQKPESNHP